MKLWQYDRGTWDLIEDPFTWESGVDWEKVSRRLGYGSPADWGGEDTEFRPNFAVYEALETTTFTQRWPYLIDVSVGGDCSSFVLVPELPSLLLFLKEYGPIFEAARIGGYLEELHGMAKKLFHAEHGHYPYDVCRNCAPVEYRRQEEAVRRARSAATAERALRDIGP
jgi:hypothetical protein